MPDGDGGTLRMAYVEAGPADGPVVLLLHGEPTWSFLYRHVMRVLADAGLRAIAPDLVGFGRSDKPTAVADHSYARHVEWTRALVLDLLDLHDVTLVGQDWGGLIGLRLVAEHPDRFARVVAANTGLPTGDRDMPEVWWQFRRAVETAEVLDVGRLVASGCVRGLTPTRRARRTTRRSPTRRSKAGAAGHAAAGPDAPRRPGGAGQPRRLGGAGRLGPAVPDRLQRRRPDHRRDGADPAQAGPGRRGARPPGRRGRRPLPPGGRRRGARPDRRGVHGALSTGRNGGAPAPADWHDRAMSVLHHRVDGTGPTVLLLHAGVADSRMWDTQVEELVPGHHVVRCDLRGYGRTPLAPGASYSDARDVLELLEALGVERCTVVAASYGGWVAQQVACAAPARVERLVLLAPLAEVVAPDAGLRAFWREEESLVGAGDLDGATALNVATFLGPDAADDARHLVATMQRGILAHQTAAGDVENAELPVDLDRLTMPVTVVAGPTTCRSSSRPPGRCPAAARRRARRAALGRPPALPRAPARDRPPGAGLPARLTPPGFGRSRVGRSITVCRRTTASRGELRTGSGG